MFHQLYNWVLHWAQTPQADWALLILAFVESSFFPLPPDVLLITLALSQPHRAFFYACVCVLGSVSGGVFGYGIGYVGGRPLLKRFIKPETLKRVEDLFNKYDAWAIFIAALTPIPYKVFTLASGVFQVNLKIFVFASVLGRGLRFFLIATLIFIWGKHIKIFLESYLELISIGIVFIIVGIVFCIHWFKNKKSHI